MEANKIINNCLQVASNALSYLSTNKRPIEGQARYNAEHLLQLSRELMRTDEALRVEPSSPEPSGERVGEEQLDALAEMSATVGVKGKLLMQLIDEIREHRRIESAYKRGGGK